MQSTGDEGRRENCGCGVCAAYKSYNIPGALEVAVAPREGWRIRTPSIRQARGLIPPPAGGLCTRCHDVGIADFPATATLLVSVRPCIITSKVKQQVMGSMDQRVPWNQFIREAKVGHSGSPTCDCCGIRRWTCYKKCTSASALSPQLLLVRRESAGVQECAGVILWTSLCRRNVSTFV